MHKTLVSMGFSEKDTQVYIYLATEGPQKARDITGALKIHRRQLYYTLKRLQSKGVINATPQCPARFSVVLFEKVLDILIKAKMEQQKSLEDDKEKFLSAWRSIKKKDTPKS